ncbi:phage tail length tape measure family protein [Pandoraea sp. PE-S2R-1]|uniref:phage tail length tape measure family protein n=1 Tax=Pandoraea sp. PE-S2R-1 TaxID=1986994 RepID=UPI000B3FA828|nr:phage tail length tape measure family protein [Pandoraea sp. PE-S2R-1]
MSDLIGKAVIAVEANTTALKASMAEGAQSVKQLEATATAAGTRSSAAFKGMSDAATTGARASESSIRSFMSSLERQSVQVTQGKAAWLEMRAAQLGVADSAAPMISAMKKAEEGVHGLNFATGAARKEMLVLAHEASQGAWKNFAGSMMVLGERTDALAVVLSSAGVSVALVAAGIGAFVLAAIQGRREAEEFTRSLQLTGNAAGVTRDAVNSMALAIAKDTGKGIGTAQEALQALISTGRFTGQSIQTLGEDVVKFSELTGAKLEDVVADYAKMPDGVAKWAAEHNRSMHFMDTATYEYVRSLEEAGRVSDAVRVVSEALHRQLVNDANDKLGTAAKAWRDFRLEISKTWAALKQGFSSGPTNTDKIETLLSERRDLESMAKRDGWGGDSARERIANIDKQVRSLQSLKVEEQRLAEAAARRAQEQEAGIAATDALHKQRLQYDKNFARQQALDQFDRHVSDLRKTSPNSAELDPAALAATRKGIIEQFTDKKAESDAQNALNARLEALQQQYKAEEDGLKSNLAHLKSLREQGLLSLQDELQQEHDARQQSLTKQLGIIQQQEELAKGKKQLAAYQKYAGEEAQIRQKLAENDRKFADDSDALQKKQARDLQAYVTSLDKSLQTRREAITQSVESIGMGDTARDQFSRLTAAAKEYDQKLSDLTRSSIEKRIDPSQYDAELKALQDFYDKRVAMEYDATDRIRAAQGNWLNGAQRAWENFNDKALNVADQVGTSFSNVYEGLTDAAAKWATGTKMSIADIGTAFAQELIKMSIRAAASPVFGALTGFLGSAFAGGYSSSAVNGGLAGSYSGSFSSGLSGGTGMFTMPSAKGNVFASGSVVHAFAKGGAFTNQVVSQPTLAPMALFGEAGEEAIMPLKRGSDGSLGVRASIDVGSGTQVHNYTNVDLNVQASSGGAAGFDGIDARDLKRAVHGWIDERMDKKMRGQGGYASQMKYGQLA